MAARKPGRYLAPIALLAIAAAVFLVVHSHLGSSGTSSSTRGNVINLIHSPRTSGAAKHRARTFYVVQRGDTLSAIAVKTGVSVPELELLNPRINPNALQTGQRLRLRK